MSEEELNAVANVLELKGTLGELFSMKVYRRNLILLMVLWSFSSFAFFLVPFYIGNNDLNIYLISLCLGLGEVISTLICMFVTHGRDTRKSLIVFCAVSCVGSLGALVFSSVYKGSSQVPEAATYLVLYVGVVTCFDLVYLIVVDLFPTIFLATAYGACNVVGRFVSILAPLMAGVPAPWPMLNLTAFSAICIALPFCLVKVDHQQKGKAPN